MFIVFIHFYHILIPHRTPFPQTHQPATAAVLEQILKATQTTSAMKGADERELVLGRLVGVSSLALSDRLGSDQESAEGALKVGLVVGRRYSRSQGGRGGSIVGTNERRCSGCTS